MENFFYFRSFWWLFLAIVSFPNVVFPAGDVDPDSLAGEYILAPPVQKYENYIEFPLDDTTSRRIYVFTLDNGSNAMTKLAHTPILALVENPSSDGSFGSKYIFENYTSDKEEKIYGIRLLLSNYDFRQTIKEQYVSAHPDRTIKKIKVSSWQSGTMVGIISPLGQPENVLAKLKTDPLTSAGDIVRASVVLEENTEEGEFEKLLSNGALEIHYKYSYLAQNNKNATASFEANENFQDALERALESKQIKFPGPISQEQLTSLATSLEGELTETVWAQDIELMKMISKDIQNDFFDSSYKDLLEALSDPDLGERVSNYLNPVIDTLKKYGAKELSAEQFNQLTEGREVTSTSSGKIKVGVKIPIMEKGSGTFGFEASNKKEIKKTKENVERILSQYGIEHSTTSDTNIVNAHKIKIFYEASLDSSRTRKIARKYTLESEALSSTTQESPVPTSFTAEAIRQELANILYDLQEKDYDGCFGDNTTDGRFATQHGGCEDKLVSTVWSDFNNDMLLNFDAASKYCGELDQGGIESWELPTVTVWNEASKSDLWRENLNMVENKSFWAREGIVVFNWKNDQLELSQSSQFNVICFYKHYN